jgi:hypothetical protein
VTIALRGPNRSDFALEARPARKYHRADTRREILMPRAREKTTENPLKQTGANKARRREMADQAAPLARRTPADLTRTGQGGSAKGGGRADTRHPAQRGGVKHEHDEGQVGGRGRRQSQLRARRKSVTNIAE